MGGGGKTGFLKKLDDAEDGNVKQNLRIAAFSLAVYA